MGDARGDRPPAAERPAPPRRDAFRYFHPMEVRFRDLDSMGHAHHSLPLIYFEEARAAYWREVKRSAGLDAIDYVIGEALVRYHARIRYPSRVEVGVRAAELGRSSFALEYGLWAEDGAALASGRTVQVMFDYAAARSRPLAPELRERIEAVSRGLSRAAD